MSYRCRTRQNISALQTEPQVIALAANTTNWNQLWLAMGIALVLMSGLLGYFSG